MVGGQVESELNACLPKSRMLGWEYIVLLAWSRRHSRGHTPVMGLSCHQGPGGSWASWLEKGRENCGFSKLSVMVCFAFSDVK